MVAWLLLLASCLYDYVEFEVENDIRGENYIWKQNNSNKKLICDLIQFKFKKSIVHVYVKFEMNKCTLK